MKIALAASTHFGQLGWFLEKNLKIMGHQVVPIVVDEHYPLSFWQKRFFKIPKLGPLLIQLYNKVLLEQTKRHQVDMLLVCKGDFIFSSTIQKIKQKNILTVNVYPDGVDMLYEHNIVNCISAYDFFFTKEPFILRQRELNKTNNVYYLPHCCDPSIHKTPPPNLSDLQTFGANVGIVGNIYPARYEFLSQLANYPMKIWGSCYVPLSKKDPLKPYYQGREANGHDQSKAFFYTKINLNNHHKQDIEGVNQRAFEIAGSGGFQLISCQPDLPNLFKPNEEIITYNDIKDLKQKIDYYLKNEKERKEIAQRAQIRAHKDHSYQKRLSQLFEYINKY